jgi:hypothetical protein
MFHQVATLLRMAQSQDVLGVDGSGRKKNHPNIGYSIPLLVMSTRFDLFVSLLRRTFGRTTLFRDAFPTRRTS